MMNSIQSSDKIESNPSQNDSTPLSHSPVVDEYENKELDHEMLQRDFRKVIAENSELKEAAIKMIEFQAKTIDALKADKEKLVNENVKLKEDHDTEIVRLETKNEQQIVQLKETNKELQAKNIKLTNTVDSLKTSLEDFEKAKAQKESESSAIKRTCDGKETELENEVNRLNNVINFLQNTLQTATESIDALKAQKEKLVNENDKLKEDHAAEIIRLKTLLAAAEKQEIIIQKDEANQQIDTALRPETPVIVELDVSLSYSSLSNVNVQQQVSPQKSKANGKKGQKRTTPSSAISSAPYLQLQTLTRPKRSQSPWRTISGNVCRKLCSENYFLEDFVRALLPKLYSFAELLLPLKKISKEKKEECIAIASYLYQHRNLGWTLMEKEVEIQLRMIRTQRRAEIYEGIGKTKGYGIASNGKYYFYEISTRMCFKNDECDAAENLQTRLVGDIPVPEFIGNFDYILLFEKPGHYANIQKLYANGEIEKM